MKLIKCPHCNKETSSDGNFCERCGEKLSKVCNCWKFKCKVLCRHKKCPNTADLLKT